MDDLQREISDLKDQLEEKEQDHFTEMNKLKQRKQETEHEIKLLQSEVTQG
jgi:cell division protein FtsB